MCSQAQRSEYSGKPICEDGCLPYSRFRSEQKIHTRKARMDSIALERIEMACDPTQHADLAAVIMQEGLANVCLITSNMTIVRAKIETNIPAKEKEAVPNMIRV
uniref:eRF1 domain-containing protein n=1 Tax=Magallana gigas TaxID=29159 RepID=A0A8W8KH66_MAGGI